MATTTNNEEQIDLNTASEDDLKDVTFMGDKRAKALVVRRDRHGPFESWKDIEKIPGFSKTMVEALQDRCFIKKPEPVVDKTTEQRE